MNYTEDRALEAAIYFANQSSCQKSKRGVIIFTREEGQLSHGYNEQPAPFVCDGSDQCKNNCNKICIHAEMSAILNDAKYTDDSWNPEGELELLHVKVVDGKPVPSGPPSCWQCSRLILHYGIKKVWLLHEAGLTCYSAIDFHQKTLEYNGISVPGKKP